MIFESELSIENEGAWMKEGSTTGADAQSN